MDERTATSAFSRMSDRLNAAFAHTLKACRLTTGFSQEELSHRSGLDRTYISALERGRRNPTLGTVAKIAAALELDDGAFLQALSERLVAARPDS